MRASKIAAGVVASTCLIGYLFFHFRNKEGKDIAAVADSSSVEKRVGDVTGPAGEGSDSFSANLPARNHTSASATSSRLGEDVFSASEMMEATRLIVMQNQRRVYGAFFDKSNLSEEVKLMVLEILTDNMMSGLERNIQSGTSDKERFDSNQALLKKLVGENGLRDIEQTRLDFLKKERLEKFLKVVPELSDLSSDGAATLGVVLDRYEPSHHVVELLAKNEPVTQEVETAIRHEFIEERGEKIEALRKSLTPAQLEAFRKWAEEEFEKQLAFVKSLKLGKS